MHDWFQRAIFRENVYELSSSTVKDGVTLTLDDCIFYMKITFLNGELVEQIYMQQVERFVIQGKQDMLIEET